jgi:8-oxo-dGTP pyrophosphatase MutT (NUDIX family)
MPEFTIILFVLPDGRLVLQRRTKDAPYAPGLLGIFGGGVEKGETPDECLIRELKEEVDLDTDKLVIESITDFVIPANKAFPKGRRFYLYKTSIENMDFDIYEGERAEAYSINELKKRHDLSDSAQHTFNKVMKGGW